jgi:hypothetical protein
MVSPLHRDGPGLHPPHSPAAHEAGAARGAQHVGRLSRPATRLRDRRRVRLQRTEWLIEVPESIGVELRRYGSRLQGCNAALAPPGTDGWRARWPAIGPWIGSCPSHVVRGSKPSAVIFVDQTTDVDDAEQETLVEASALPLLKAVLT